MKRSSFGTKRSSWAALKCSSSTYPNAAPGSRLTQLLGLFFYAAPWRANAAPWRANAAHFGVQTQLI